MRPYANGESSYNLIRSAIPNFVEADYPLFVEFVSAFLRFLEQPRTFEAQTVTPDYGALANSTVTATTTLGGSFYEARKLLEYRDAGSTLDEFKSHFLSMFGKNFPQFSHISTDLFIQSLRQFYAAKGTDDTIRWFFQTIFNEPAEVYYPRTDILRTSDGTWSAPQTLKVSAPIDGHLNGDVAQYYVGQRIQTATGSAQVEKVVTSIVGQAYNQNITVNELFLKFDSVLGSFEPGQELINVDSAVTVQTLILPVISDLIIETGGSNYVIGDLVTFSEGPTGGYGYGAFGVVIQTSNTAINGVNVIDGGDGFVVGTPVLMISSSGDGATAEIAEISFGNILLEDGTGYLTLEQQTSGDTNRFQLEDKDTINLELVIGPFVNATATVTLDSPDYGVATGVTQMDGVELDSSLEIALAAADEQPFMIPWVFTNDMETNAALANAATQLITTSNVFFANAATVFRISTLQDITTNVGTANVSANIIVSQLTTGESLSGGVYVPEVLTLYLKDITGANLFTTGMFFKATGNGTTQTGTVTSNGTANLVGSNTFFMSTFVPGAHLRLSDGTHLAVKTVVNNTFLIAYAPTGVSLSNVAYSVIPTGTVPNITLQQQVYYGKIKRVQLLTNGANYETPPTAVVDSVDARAQELFHLVPDPSGNTANNQVVASSGVTLFDDASLTVAQDAGQVQKVKITASGVNYQDANDVIILALHSGNNTGTNAQFTPVIGALTQYPGEFTTSRGFLSADKYLQDGEYYNNYTYVIRVAESFDRYRDLLLRLLHPAGFKALGQFVETLDAPLTVPDAECFFSL